MNWESKLSAQVSRPATQFVSVCAMAGIGAVLALSGPVTGLFIAHDQSASIPVAAKTDPALQRHLFTAVRNNNLNAVRSIVDSGAGVSKRNSKGQTPFNLGNQQRLFRSSAIFDLGQTAATVAKDPGPSRRLNARTGGDRDDQLALPGGCTRGGGWRSTSSCTAGGSGTCTCRYTAGPKSLARGAAPTSKGAVSGRNNRPIGGNETARGQCREASYRCAGAGRRTKQKYGTGCGETLTANSAAGSTLHRYCHRTGRENSIHPQDQTG